MNHRRGTGRRKTRLRTAGGAPEQLRDDTVQPLRIHGHHRLSGSARINRPPHSWFPALHRGALPTPHAGTL